MNEGNNIIDNLDLAGNTEKQNFNFDISHEENCEWNGKNMTKSMSNIPSYFSPTKSSELWQSQKAIKT